MSELWRMTARNVVNLLKRRELTPLDLIDASLQRIEKTDPALTGHADTPAVSSFRTKIPSFQVFLSQ